MNCAPEELDAKINKAEYTRLLNLAFPDRMPKGRRWCRYRIREPEYQNMLTQQRGRCALCGKRMARPQLDHDHITGKTRGLLCYRCNMGLGYFDDAIAGLTKAIKYLEKYVRDK